MDKKYEEMTSLEREVHNIKVAHERILKEIFLLGRIKEKRSSLSPNEISALEKYERDLRLDYLKSLALAQEFEETFNVPNLASTLEAMTIKETPNRIPTITLEERDLITKAVLRDQNDDRFYEDLENARKESNKNRL